MFSFMHVVKSGSMYVRGVRPFHQYEPAGAYQGITSHLSRNSWLFRLPQTTAADGERRVNGGPAAAGDDGGGADVTKRKGGLGRASLALETGACSRSSRMHSLELVAASE